MSPGSPGREAKHTVLKEHDESPAPQMAPKSEAPSTDLSQARPHTVRPTAVTRHELSLEVEFNHRHVFRLPYEFIRDSCPSNFDKRRGERVFSISSGRFAPLHIALLHISVLTPGIGTSGRRAPSGGSGDRLVQGRLQNRSGLGLWE